VRRDNINVLDKLLRMNLTEDVFGQVLGILEHEQHTPMRKHQRIRKAGVPQGDPND